MVNTLLKMDCGRGSKENQTYNVHLVVEHDADE